MRKILAFRLGLFAFVFSITTSCSKELIDDGLNLSHPYLNRITTFDSKGNSEYIFLKPQYNDIGRIISVYNDIVGYDAYYAYEYYPDSIAVTLSSKDGGISKLSYLIKDGLIILCKGYIADPLTTRYISLNYGYEGKFLTTISGKDLYVSNSGDIDDFGGNLNIKIEWNGGNISKIISYSDKSDFIGTYTYEYVYEPNYQVSFPMIQLSCYYLGGVMGIDEALASCGYFGTVSSKDLPVKEYYSDRLTRVFRYSLNKDGYISEIKQMKDDNSDRVVMSYVFDWK